MRSKQIRGMAEAVAPVFQQKGWAWASVPGIPNADQIAETIGHCVAEVKSGKTGDQHASGRLVAVREDYGVQVYLDVGFIKDTAKPKEPRRDR